MKIDWKKLFICIVIPNAAGAASSLITGGGMNDFEMLVKPPLSPPGWLFPVVWTILYTLMGIASYLVLTSEVSPDMTRTALTVYGIQLAVNVIWPILFFSLEAYLFSFIWLLILWLLIIVTAVLFYSVSKPAGILMLPYLAWVTFAGYLNFAIYLLN